MTASEVSVDIYNQTYYSYTYWETGPMHEKVGNRLRAVCLGLKDTTR